MKGMQGIEKTSDVLTGMHRMLRMEERDSFFVPVFHFIPGHFPD